MKKDRMEKAINKVLIAQAEQGDEKAIKALQRRMKIKGKIRRNDSRKVKVKITDKHGNITIADSMEEASKITGLSRSAVRYNIDNVNIDRRGYAYERID